MWACLLVCVCLRVCMCACLSFCAFSFKFIATICPSGSMICEKFYLSCHFLFIRLCLTLSRLFLQSFSLISFVCFLIVLFLADEALFALRYWWNSSLLFPSSYIALPPSPSDPLHLSSYSFHDYLFFFATPLSLQSLRSLSLLFLSFSHISSPSPFLSLLFLSLSLSPFPFSLTLSSSTQDSLIPLPPSPSVLCYPPSRPPHPLIHMRIVTHFAPLQIPTNMLQTAQYATQNEIRKIFRAKFNHCC